MADDNSQNSFKKPKFNIYWVYGLIFLGFLAIQFTDFGTTSNEITWHKFEKDLLSKHYVERVVVVNRIQAEVYIKEQYLNSGEVDGLADQDFNGFQKGPHFTFNIGSLENFEKRMEEAQTGVEDSNYVSVAYETRKDILGDVFSWVFPILILVAVWLFIFKKMGSGGGGAGGGNIFSIGKSKAKVFDNEDDKIKTNFSDVAGLEEAKVEISEIVQFLKNPDKYTELGGKIPKGALLVGPPGTGKTLLAKAVAGEAEVPFFSLSGSDFVEMFVGVGASRVRDLFGQAKQKAPCIIFIDEIDAIGRARGRNANFGSNDERENTLNQLLTEMDGFDTNAGVILLAATNRADILDPALLRAGRFDRQVHVELPDLIEREAIFNVHIRPIKIDEQLDVATLAKQTPGFSGADIANVCNEAALIAARKEKKQVDKQDFIDAVDRIVGGLEKKNKLITVHEKKTIAYHEAGHASVSWLLEHAHPLIKVTIVPRGQALGAAWYLPKERQITTEEQMLDDMCATLGGRAAEEVFFNKISTGALNDLEKVTKQAYAMIAYYGMSKKVGNLSFYDSSGSSDYSFQKPYSDKTAELIDAEVNTLVETSYKKAIKLLKENKEKITKLAELLLEKEVIFTEDVERVLGKRKYNNPEEDILFSSKFSSKKAETLINETKKDDTEQASNDNEVETDESKSVE